MNKKLKRLSIELSSLNNEVKNLSNKDITKGVSSLKNLLSNEIRELESIITHKTKEYDSKTIKKLERTQELLDAIYNYEYYELR